jgi:hypothetical protein
VLADAPKRWKIRRYFDNHIAASHRRLVIGERRRVKFDLARMMRETR